LFRLGLIMWNMWSEPGLFFLKQVFPGFL